MERISLIAAMDNNRAIGKDNTIPWHIPSDMKLFKLVTSNSTVIMGRKTWESIGKPLPDRTNIVVTHQENYEVPENVIVANSLEEAIETAPEGPKWLIGGSQLYSEALDKDLISDMLITQVDTEIDGADTWFPEIDMSLWGMDQKFTVRKQENDYPFTVSDFYRKD